MPGDIRHKVDNFEEAYPGRKFYPDHAITSNGVSEDCGLRASRGMATIRKYSVISQCLPITVSRRAGVVYH